MMLGEVKVNGVLVNKLELEPVRRAARKKAIVLIEVVVGSSTDNYVNLKEIIEGVLLLLN